jgi:DNA-directed RNA polymerase subunit RPC12/RpoP
MKITIQNLTIDFSLESENKLSPEHQEHSAYESELEGVIKKLSTIVDEKEKELSELRALCDAPLPLELQGYLDEIGNLKTELRDAKSQIETLKSMLIAEPSPVAKDPEGTTSPSPVAEALEATETTTTKKEISCTCKVCNKTFYAFHNRVQFCSDECRSANKTQKQSADHVTIKTKKCIECGSEFQPTSNRQVRCETCGIKKKSRKLNSAQTKAQKN